MAKKILLIDDAENLLKVLVRRLETEGYEVYTARDGLEGLAMLEKNIPDLIVLDVAMPKMDGYAFVRKMREDGRFHRLPVIVLTGKHMLGDLFALEGVHEYVLKPFDARELLEKIARLIDKSVE